MPLRCCWAAPHIPTSLVVAQPADQRKSPGTLTEISTILWIGDLTHLRPKDLEQYLTVYSRLQARYGSNLGYSGEKEATIYSWN